ncbi:hypothetical protein LCGC14_0445300 [marine sediment metagenome]|uniref:Uncharacterized protein n=1 Tax=marine sediment metagenome TaxID=412755 RepID=A0A0F9VTH2_9ZZZZ
MLYFPDGKPAKLVPLAEILVGFRAIRDSVPPPAHVVVRVPGKPQYHSLGCLACKGWP